MMRLTLYFIALALLLGIAPAYAQSDDPHWQFIADGFTFVTAIVQPPQDDIRLFVADLRGTVHIVQYDIRLPTPFLDIRDHINTETFGQGLLGMAFHPDFAENGTFFVTYSDLDNSPVLARYRVSDINPNLADPASEQVVLKLDHASPLHNGGDIAFGPDGYLYWTVGDGAYKRSPAQNVRSHLGGMLRLDVDGGSPYSVPADNPYLDVPDALPELWSKGLRNPWRLSFDRLTGDLYIADVGEAQMEEINFQPAHSTGGENYGWNLFEGTWRYLGGSDDGLTFPVVEYPHDNGSCSITGGYVYRGAALPKLVGKYVFSDYCSGILWSTYRRDDGSWYTAQVMDTRFTVTTFGQDNAGELYIGDTSSGAVYRLIATGQPKSKRRTAVWLPAFEFHRLSLERDVVYATCATVVVTTAPTRTAAIFAAAEESHIAGCHLKRCGGLTSIVGVSTRFNRTDDHDLPTFSEVLVAALT